ncbi:NUDIX domain-containing protein [Thermoleptolyngbya sichuanensis A183]|uniref:NUDIX domain-containing protein n=1 Tax=Thermoleptolyngbya sichuanensis A183 TaxID=2737172 RepID=A0A6M8BB89_9CYAN|nr:MULTISPECIES: NUDIX domain-containing protein [Thermoleptolyngbya]QKD83322.1 NUDIX domain-containing protein [Thermoleptolyngbya sichuanensis A183]
MSDTQPISSIPGPPLRVAVVALFVDGDEVLMLHQVSPPEPDCWDLPGGGLEPMEPILTGLRREVWEETGIQDFQCDRLLTVFEQFFPNADAPISHTIHLIHQCTLPVRPAMLQGDPTEVGPEGIQWRAIANLRQEDCSARAWAALRALGRVA